MKKNRLDQLVVEKGYAPSRERAKSLIIAGKVLVNDEPITKSGESVLVGSRIRIRGEDHPYVSRGGIKLREALKQFQVVPDGKVALDVGASTGGFTDVLLQNGAHQVFAVDVGHNQLDWKIRNDARVVSLEGENARYLEFNKIGQKVDIIVMDVSFISVTKILPRLKNFTHPATDWVVLIKPQFEVGREKVGKGGIVREERYREEAVETVIQKGENLGLVRRGLIESPIRGSQGNREFFVYFQHASNF